jgi:hypothetical protein
MIGIKIIKSEENNIYFGLLKFSLTHEKGLCYRKDAISYRLSGGLNLFEDGLRTDETIKEVKQN